MGIREEQLELETQYDTAAAANRLAELQQAAADGDTELPRASRLISRMHQDVAAYLDAYRNTQTRGIGGKYKRWLRALPLDVAAVLAIQISIQLCTRDRGAAGLPTLIQDLASEIGKHWELEARIREAEAVNPVYMQRVHEQVQQNGTKNERHLRNLYNSVYDKVMKGEIDSNITVAERIQIGKAGVQACLEAGLLTVSRETGAKGVIVKYSLTPEIAEYLQGYDEGDVRYVYDRQASAMLCPPDEWETVQDGGYLSLRRKHSCPLVSLGRSARPHWRKYIREEVIQDKQPLIFEVANYLQGTAFEVHAPTLAAIHKVWEAGGGVLGVPVRSGPKKPVCPLPEGWEKASGTPEELEAFTAWKRAAVMYYLHAKEWRSKVRELAGFLNSADMHARPIWFPVHMDRRGRWYYRGVPNPQGSDLSKGVLHFAEKRALGRDGVFWLKVHIANSLGFDKERFVDRARWVDQNWEALSRALDAPEDAPEVWGTDAPWCAFSAAWELREALRSGNPEKYVTGQIVHMDATCSGLQHFSAMLRDPVGGRYVNLFDAQQCGPKQDIYAQVALNALASIRLDLDNPDQEVQDMASWWLKVGIPRKLAKKPVMTYVYGATLRGTARHIEEVVVSEMPEALFPDEALAYKYCHYAARKLFDGIASTVPAAAAAMRWLRDVAAQLSGKAMKWRAPTGFPVIHDYPDVEMVRIPVRSCGIHTTIAYEVLPGTNLSRMRNAVSPNFVHALDASHLTLTAKRMKAEGMCMVGIHDSFGTHPADVPKMHTCIREAFIEMYKGRNTLGEFLWEVGGVGEPPARGALDIEAVRDSEFFFC